MNWIPTTDQLPPVDEDVLIWIPGANHWAKSDGPIHSPEEASHWARISRPDQKSKLQYIREQAEENSPIGKNLPREQLELAYSVLLLMLQA